MDVGTAYVCYSPNGIVTFHSFYHIGIPHTQIYTSIYSIAHTYFGGAIICLWDIVWLDSMKKGVYCSWISRGKGLDLVGIGVCNLNGPKVGMSVLCSLSGIV